ncbi:MAG: CRISPR-associated endonuclease Cas1 [Chthoniobacterales bacterium]|nr:CRISPR-associated endonuclease Cas1 [Chthoniobacterales bacterium]
MPCSRSLTRSWQRIAWLPCCRLGSTRGWDSSTKPRPGRPALALDLMEEFRPILADSAVLHAVNNRMVQPEDSVQAGDGVNLGAHARKRFFCSLRTALEHHDHAPLV